MFCKECGHELPEGSEICEYCGSPCSLEAAEKMTVDEEAAGEETAEEETAGEETANEEAAPSPYTYTSPEEHRPDPVSDADSASGAKTTDNSYAYGGAADTGRIPYLDQPAAVPEREGTISTLAMIAGIASIFSLFVPYIAIPVSLMAVLFGILGYRQTVLYRRRAVCGIVTGVIALLFGSVLLFCVFALRPYNEDLYQIFREYFSSLR